MLAVMEINRGAQIRFCRGDAATAFARLVALAFVPGALLAPDPAPVIPALKARHDALEVVGIDTRRQIARGVVAQDKVNQGLTRHDIPVRTLRSDLCRLRGQL